MQNVLAIWQREIKSYFVSPIAYVVLTIFLFITGGIFSILLYLNIMQSQMGRGMQPIDIPASVTQSLIDFTGVYLLPFLIPMLTMGLFSEEKKRGTIELLLTTPVGNFSAMIGKYLASLTFLFILLAANLITISALFFYGQPDWKPILSGYLGLSLYGAAFLALGLFISTLTENQIVAVVVTFGVTIVLLLSTFFSNIAVFFIRFFFSNSVSEAAKSVFDYMSVLNHFEDFIKGVVDTSHITYYLTFVFVALFLAYRSLESMRWKG
jgi:ABC-2 type transport system permease protein